MPTKPCVGCGWCCLADQCMESHRKHGYLPRCPEIVWDAENVRYCCRLMQHPVSGAASRKALLEGRGCCAPLNSWRDNVRNRDPLPAVRPDESVREEMAGATRSREDAKV